MVAREDLITAAAAALIEECAEQGYPPDAWDNLGDGESLIWLGEEDCPAINVAVIVDAILRLTQPT